ncbi:MAG: murein L,D-transpeptidase catalytic domain family protein [Bryobacteraceae bacterium]
MICKNFSPILFFAASLPILTAAPPESSRSQLPVLLRQAPSVNAGVLEMALNAVECVQRAGKRVRDDVLLLLDYSRPSTEPRLWVFDLANGRLLFEELVAHGKNSGDNHTVRFSNQPGSLMSSLGIFLTAGTYYGKHGYSLRLQGIEDGFNDKSMQRAIVLHPADYVNEGITKRLGRLGRSWGCPAVRPAVSRRLIDTVRDGALMFAYFPQPEWLSNSKYLGCRAD